MSNSSTNITKKRRKQIWIPWGVNLRKHPEWPKTGHEGAPTPEKHPTINKTNRAYLHDDFCYAALLSLLVGISWSSLSWWGCRSCCSAADCDHQQSTRFATASEKIPFVPAFFYPISCRMKISGTNVHKDIGMYILVLKMQVGWVTQVSVCRNHVQICTMISGTKVPTWYPCRYCTKIFRYMLYKLHRCT